MSSEHPSIPSQLREDVRNTLQQARQKAFPGAGKSYALRSLLTWSVNFGLTLRNWVIAQRVPRFFLVEFGKESWDLFQQQTRRASVARHAISRRVFLFTGGGCGYEV
jgi:hypothetical protein